MNDSDLALIERLVPDNAELSHLLGKHQEYEGRLQVISRQKWRTPEEYVEEKKLKQLKLAGRDRMQDILAAHRKVASA